MTPATRLQELGTISPQRLRLLERFGLHTAGDVLLHFPRRHEDRRQFDRFPSGESDTPVCVCGTVTKTTLKRLPGWKKLFEATIEEDGGGILTQPLVCRWFNMHYIQKMIATGQQIIVYGKPKLRGNRVCIEHPEFEIIEGDGDSVHVGRITPIYRATEGLSQRVLRQTVFDVLEQMCDDEIEERLPADLKAGPRCVALRQIHFPESFDSLAAAKRHLVLDEFFTMQLFIAARRAETVTKPGEAHCGGGEWMRRFHEELPFPLTTAQRRTIDEIRADLAAMRPMNRLLHGDVGSGKTVVALSAMLLAAEAGFQATLMAPTQILAEQHYLNFKRWLEPLGIGIALRTAARKEDTGALPLFAAGSARGPRAADGGPPSAPDSPPDLRAQTSEGALRMGGARDPRAVTGDPPVTPGVRYRRGRLPHFERPWAIYAITFNTVEPRKLTFKARDLVLDAILHWKDRRYELFAACVMPDHVHLLIQPMVKETADDGSPVFFSLTEILQSIKSWTAHEINKLEGETGSLWQKEWFDRYTRSDADLQEKYHYILENPWTSHVVEPDEFYQWVWFPGCERTPVFAAGRRELHAGRVLHPSAPASDATPQIIIGTHALLYEGGFDFSRLGLVVIDEQHKFGVLQRARLIEQGTMPDVLVMTATPIPRTYTMTLYGDLDVSTLDELPAGRGKIVTAVRDTKKLPDAVKFIREQLEAGRQAYIVYPLIDESEKLEAKAATTEFEKWRALLDPMPCALLHGRVDPAEKDAVMERFRRGETKALIATSVIEVGIDVSNATVMLVENAERFGLAQLHQLRGRIGRGGHKSFCILISDAKNAEAVEKLATLERTADGFEIAEADLRLRGPGDLLGTAQSGLPPLKLGDPLADTDLMRLARNAAFLLFERDPHLERPENQRFRAMLADTRRLVLSQVS